jgi:release factor glutamine methyltransferase
MRSWPTSGIGSWTTAEDDVVIDPDRTSVATRPGRADLMATVAGIVGSTQEAVWIVEHVERMQRGDLEVAARALALADRRAAGEPLQYVLGTWQFRSLELAVDRRVLIPRPETEQVVESALGELARMAMTRPDNGDPLVCVDLGTGSGAIALSLALEGPPASRPVEVWATDRSADALEVARANLAWLERLDPDAAFRVTLVAGSWYDPLPSHLQGQVDLVVSNPPYVSEEEYGEDLDPGVRDWEPKEALVAAEGRSGFAGMADVEEVVAGSIRWLRPGGALVVELAPSQADGAVDSARQAGFARVGTARDLAGRVRMLVAAR